MSISISNTGKKFIKNEESFSNRAYWDKNGYAICFGNHFHPDGRPVKLGDIVKFEKDSTDADKYLDQHLTQRVYPLIRKVNKDLKQNEVDSLCSFIYNVGHIPNNLIKAIRDEDSNKIREEFKKKNKSNGEVLQSLKERRKRELNLYFSNVSNNAITQTNIPIKNTQGLGISSIIIEIAKSQLGVTENPRGSNSGKEVDSYLDRIGLKRGNAWCMAFVYWVYDEACKRLNIKNPLVNTGLVMSQWNLVKNSIKADNRQKHMIVPGCLFVMDYHNGKGHTGIVVSVQDNFITTIEGNTDASGGREGDGVYMRKRKIDNVSGFIIVQNLLQQQITDGNRTDVTQIQSAQQYEQESKKVNTRPYFLYKNNREEVNTMQKLIDFLQLNIEPQKLLDYEDYDNKSSVIKSYDSAKQKEFSGKASIEYLGVGAIVAIPYSVVKNKTIYSINQTISENIPYKTFIEKEAKRLFNDVRYDKVSKNGQFSEDGVLHKREDFTQVFWWSKSFNNDGCDVIDITPFIKNISINSNKNGGNFNITLADIGYNTEVDGEITTKDLRLHISKSELFEFFQKETSIVPKIYEQNRKTFYSKSDEEYMNAIYNKVYSLRNSFFEDNVSVNDLLFIRMERLKIDTLDEKLDDKLSKPNSVLPDKVFDLIGLVSSISSQVSATVNEKSITVSGMDLSKLLIDDGIYFFDVEYAVDDREQIIKNSSKTKAGNRLIIPRSSTNKDEYQSNIRNSIQGFAGDVTFNFDKTQTVTEWLTFIFSQLTNIDICADNLFSSYKEKNFIITREQNESGFAYQQIQTNGIWNIVKLAIDPEIGDRKIADSSFTTAMGSLLNLIRKICQPPFIEFFMDTYGDKFYFVCRKPPFSEDSFKSNFCINVYAEDIISAQFEKNSEFYTWYRLNPAGSIVDNTNGASLINLPAVMLPEYMEVWGSKVYDITTQYLDFDPIDSEQTKSNLDNIQKQGREDLDWLIETNAYLPFTRECTLTIKPDRRFKTGMNVRVIPTGEIYHIDGVSNSRNFEDAPSGTTTLHLSRGMVEKHIDKYFNVVNLLRNSKNSDIWDKDTWTTNQEIFNFLLKNKQFKS